LMTQVITEALTVVALGVVAGLVIGKWALALLLALAPAGIPRLSEIVLDWRIVAAGLALTPVIALLVGVVPALRLSRTRIGLSPHGSRAPRRSRTRRVLVLAQVTFAVVLTAAAGLLGRGLAHLVAIDNGFAVEPLAAVDLSMRGAGDLRPLFRDVTMSVES